MIKGIGVNYKIKTFRSPEGQGADRQIENWLERKSEEGKHIIIEQLLQTASPSYLFTTIFYTLQNKNVVVNEEEEAPESIVNFKVKKFIEGKTINFNLFLKETEINFLKDKIDRFCNGKGIVITEFYSESELIMLQELREKGILFTYRNAEGEDVFRATVLCKYFSEYYLMANNQKTIEL